MTSSLRMSTDTFDGGGGSGGHSIVEQTTDIINHFRNSLIRNRRERLLDEDTRTIENIVDRLHFTELAAKETLEKLIIQGDSMQRSYDLINKLQKEIKGIAEDLNEVNSGKCCGTINTSTLMGILCFGYSNRKKSRKKNSYRKTPYVHNLIKTTKNSDNLEKLGQSFDSFHQIHWGSAIEREEVIAKVRALARKRRENADFIHTINQLKNIKTKETEENNKKLTRIRDYLLQHHSLIYGYIDQPERLINEIDMAINFNQLNRYLDHLLEVTEFMTSEVNKHNFVITKIETQAMESENLLNNYTLVGHDILGSSSKQIETIANPSINRSNLDALTISNGKKVFLNSFL